MREWKVIASVWALAMVFAIGPPAIAGTVTEIDSNAEVTGTILVADDTDEFRFEATANAKVCLVLKSLDKTADVGLALVDPAGAQLDFADARKYRDRFWKINVGSLELDASGTYRILVTADKPCEYTLRLKTEECDCFRSTIVLPPNGDVVFPFAAPEGSQLKVQVKAQKRSRAQARIMEHNGNDTSQSGKLNRRRHRIEVQNVGEGGDQQIRVRDTGGFGGKVKVTVHVKAPKILKDVHDVSDQTEIVEIRAMHRSTYLRWLPTLDAQSYTVYWSNSPDVTPQNGTPIAGITGTEFTHTGLQNGLAYYYCVTATCLEHQEREQSQQRFTHLAPDPPDWEDATAGNGLVQLRWQPVVGGNQFRIYGSTDPDFEPGPENRIDEIPGREYTQAGLLNGETYHFRLTAMGPGGESLPGALRTVSLTPDPPGLVAAMAGDGWVEIDWGESYGAFQYNLYVSTEPDFEPADATQIADVTAPYTDLAVDNGTFYYYVVTAVGLGGESAASPQIAARPVPTPEAPLDVEVVVTEEIVNAVTLTWSPPTIGADSYTIYWSTEPGVTVDDERIENVTSPYVHTGLEGQVTHYYAISSTLFGNESELSSEMSATPHGPPVPVTEGFGNNLSFPVVFADGYGITGAEIGDDPSPWLNTGTGIRPAETENVPEFPFFDSTSAIVKNSVTYYPQKTRSTWQAEWRNGADEEQEVIADWGDNLRSQSFTTNSVVRVEMTLVQDTSTSDASDTMTAYVMSSLEGSRRDEVVGTDAVEYESNVRTVYTVTARIQAQKLVQQGGAVDDSVEGIDLAVADAFGLDGPGGFGAEVNVSGKLIYGYVWQIRNLGLSTDEKAGWWRLTFSLDPTSSVGGETVQRNVRITELDAGETGSTATLANDGRSTSIEILINQR